MTSPADVARFHAEYDRHPDDRIRLFAAVLELLPRTAKILYPGSYVDIGPSVWFDNVTYVDTDKRAARFFAQQSDVDDLIEAKRKSAGSRSPSSTADSPITTFHHLDYRTELPVVDASIDLVVSLYAGFISEHCTRYLRPGGFILANNSHGDASMASLDPRNRLAAVVVSRSGSYQITDAKLETYLQPKGGTPPTVAELHRTNRGIAYSKSAYAYIFQHG